MSVTFSKVDVITGVARRLRVSTELKLSVVAETMHPGMSAGYVDRCQGAEVGVGDSVPSPVP
jgi:transposase